MNSTEFKEQYLPYYRKLYCIAFRFLGNSEDAEDVIQELYVKLWNKREKLKFVSNPEAYSVILLRNLCIDSIRSRKISEDLDLPRIERADIDEEKLDSKYNLNDILNVLNKIPENQRMVIILKHFENYTTDEIMGIMNVSHANLRVLLSRARKNIRELIMIKHGK